MVIRLGEMLGEGSGGLRGTGFLVGGAGEGPVCVHVRDHSRRFEPG